MLVSGTVVLVDSATVTQARLMNRSMTVSNFRKLTRSVGAGRRRGRHLEGWLDRKDCDVGRDGVIRTLDPLHPMQVRYQAALRPDVAAIITEASVQIANGVRLRAVPARLRFRAARWRDPAATRPARPDACRARACFRPDDCAHR